MPWTLHTQPQPTVSGYQGNSRSPLAIAATVAVYGAAIAAFLLIPSKIVMIDRTPPFWGYPVPVDPDPPLPPPPPADPRVQPKDDTNVTMPDDTKVDGPNKGDIIFTRKDSFDPINPGGDTTIDPPKVDPVFVRATLDDRRRADVQPPYPGAMIRAQMEGFAKVHVFIGADGRVSSVELIEATDPAFWEATRKQALRYWRFRPATRDGMPVPSDQIMTVRFRLADV